MRTMNWIDSPPCCENRSWSMDGYLYFPRDQFCSAHVCAEILACQDSSTRVLGLAHPAYNALLLYHNGPVQTRFHAKALNNSRESIVCHRDLFNRSLFGYVDVYNRLPQYVIDCESISSFQHELTVICKRRCRQGVQSWKHSFNMYRTDFDADVFNVDAM